MGCVNLLPLCSVPPVGMREAMVGANAYGNFIGIGLWFASGQTLTFPNDRAVQDKSKVYLGTIKPNTYSKGFSCSVPASCNGFVDPGVTVT